MRIVAGRFGGRNLSGPKSSVTRPMTDKVRAALFDRLGDITGYVVMDAYAGSGLVGLEALSRGAAQVTAIESNRQAIHVIRENQTSLEVDFEYLLFPVTVESWLARPQNLTSKYDLIVADPPYSQLRPDVLEKLGGLLQPNGRLAVSHTSRQPSPELGGLRLTSARDYGDSSVTIYELG